MDKFSNYFMRKITIIRNKIISDCPNNTCNIVIDADIMFNGKMLEIFPSASEVDVKEIITKSCNLDPLPTCLLKKCVDQLLPLITGIINRSVVESVMSLCLKRATITPLFKRYGLDRTNMKNCHPISNLPFISKLLKRYKQGV